MRKIEFLRELRIRGGANANANPFASFALHCQQRMIERKISYIDVMNGLNSEDFTVVRYKYTPSENLQFFEDVQELHLEMFDTRGIPFRVVIYLIGKLHFKFITVYYKNPKALHETMFDDESEYLYEIEKYWRMYLRKHGHCMIDLVN